MDQRIMPHDPTSAPTLTRRADVGLSALGALAGFGAVLAAASCCVLPLALAALGVSAALSSTFDPLMALRWPLTVVSAMGLAAGWWSYARRRKICAADKSCTIPLPSSATPIVLAMGTSLTLIALIWDRLEAPLMKALT